MSTCLKKNYRANSSKVSVLRICFFNCGTMIFKRIMSKVRMLLLFNPQ